MNLIYKVEDKPKFLQLIVFAIQQLLAIMAATLVVPVIINGNANLTGENAMSTAAALFGAGIGTIIYVLFTKRKSPVFLGSSFAFIGSMTAAFAGATGYVALGYLGLILGALFAGLVYVIIAILVKIVGVGWLNKLMPPVVIGPTVAIIGLSLAANAIGDLTKGSVTTPVIELIVGQGENGAAALVENTVYKPIASPLIAIVCGLVTLIVTVLCSTYGKRMMKLIPFILGILAGYIVAAIFTIIGNVYNIDALKITDFAPLTALASNGVNLKTFFTIPDFTFLTAYKGIKDINASYIGTIAMAYVPVAFVVFAEHVADHKNISSIIGKDLLEEPGLSRTLLGDGIGSMAGAMFGGCPNTTYGESVACVAITRNASVSTIITAAIGALLISFFTPFVAFVNSIPSCVMGGVCMALYGFIAVSGLKMLQKVDLNKNRNLFTASVILIAGIGGLTISFGAIQITAVACALILGIIVNLILSKEKAEETEE